MMKKCTKLITYVMVFVMLFNSIPLPAVALLLEDYNSNRLTVESEKKESSDSLEEVIAEDNIDSHILYEIEDKREASKKYFKLDDGTEIATIYADPVHYEVNGKWGSIDNSLIVNNDNQLENQAADYKVKYEQSSSDGKIFEIEKAGYKIELSLKEKKNIKSKIKNNSKKNNNKKSTQVDNLSSSIVYEEVATDVDMEYITLPTKIKENITLKTNKATHKYEYDLNLDERLIAKLNETNEVIITDSKTKDIIYVIEAPYMYDSNMVFSSDIKISLKKENNNTYTYSLTADKSWLNDKERAYPVVIDPTVVTDQARTAIQDCYIYEGDTNNSSKCNAHILRVGNSKFAEVNSKPVRSIVQFDLPSLETGDQVINARFSLFSYNYSLDGLTYPNTEIQIDVHKILTSWTSANANWSRLGATTNWEAKVTDYLLFNYTTADPIKRYDADITRIVKEWYNTGQNYGLMLKSLEGTTSMRADAFSFSSDTSSSYTSKRPSIVIQYRNQTGLEDYQTFSNHTFGNNAVYVNNYNGNLVALHEDIATPGNLLPVSINHVYNTNDAATNIGYGFGYRLNLNQTLEFESGGSLFKFIDEDGTRHWFYKDGDNYKDESGLGLTLSPTGTSSQHQYTMTDKAGNKSKFNKYGEIFYLIEIIDASTNNKIIINYNTSNYNLITSVKDGAGKTINLTYTSNLLSKITDLAGREINYTYSNTNLITIKYPDNSVTSYAYNANHFLTKITDVDGNYENYAYYASKPYRLNTIKEYSSSGVLGQNLTFTYSENTTVIKDGVNRTYNYSFNNWGQTTSITDLGKGISPANAYGQSYLYNTTTNSVNANKLLSIGNLEKSTNNLIINSGAEASASWTTYQNGTNLGTLGYVTNEKYLGNRSFRIATTTKTNTQPIYYQVVPFEKGKTYNFSAYIKGIIDEKDVANSGVFFAFEYKNASGVFQTYIKYFDITNNWERYDYTLKIPEDYNNTPHIVFGINNAKGTVYFDNLQLEESNTINPYNLADNGNFSRGETGWTKRANLTTSDAVVTIDGVTAFKITGNSKEYKNIYRIYDISGLKDDVYNLSYWGKNLGVPGTLAFAGQTGIAPLPAKNSRMVLQFLNSSDAILQEEILNLPSDTSNWQFISKQIKANQTYAKVKIYCTFDNNLGTSYFSNIGLFKDELTTSLNYDSTGNLTNITDSTNNKEGITYDKKNQLVSQTNSKNRTTINEYDYKYTNRILKSFSNDGLISENNYDPTGNLTKTKTSEKSRVTAINTTKEYYIKAYGSNLYLGLNGNLNTANIPVQLTPKDDTGKQIWNFESAIILGDYKIKSSRSTNQKLDIKGALLTNGTIVQVYPNNTNKAQEFKVVLNDDGTFTFKTALTNYASCVDVASALTYTPGTTIQQYTCNNSFAQKFILEEVNESNTKYIETSAEYSADGRFQTKLIDQREQVVQTDYNQNTGNISSTIDPNSNTTSYTYDNLDRITNVSNGSANNSYNYSYNKLNYISHNGFTYDFGYDAFNNIQQVKVGTQALITNTYAANNGNLTKSTYGNGHEISYVYDNFDRITKKSNSLGNIIYTYDNRGNIGKINDNINNIEKNFNYDLAGRITKYQENDNYKINYNYDTYSNLVKKDYSFNNTNKSISYTYDIDDKIIDINNIKYGYDTLNRLSSKTINNNYQTKYNYLNLNTSKTTTLIESIENANNKLSYTYDNNGNIETIKKNNTLINKYYYDSLNQLIKEDNAILNKTISYTYDNGGNLTNKKYYNYQGTSVSETINYSYTNNNWKDQLTSYNGKTINYDAIGNPTSYDGNTYTWTNGRELSKITKGTNTYEYKYNENGIRTEKKVNGVLTNYYLENTNIIYENRNGNLIYYLYDDSGVSGIEYKGTTYYFIKNTQGDIIGILDVNLNQIVSYEYDSWGKLISVKDNQGNNITSTSHIGNINPFRYRGYYYDTETELYYLNSRYYNPEWGRFINADGMMGAGGSLLAYNLYTYCFNNPVNLSDHSGTTPTDAMLWASKNPAPTRYAPGTVSAAVLAASMKAYSVWKTTFDALSAKPPVTISNGSKMSSSLVGTVSLGTHKVLGSPFQHASITVSGYIGNDANLIREFSRGYMTIGAGEVNGKLTSGINRDKDIKRNNKTTMTPVAAWDNAAIESAYYAVKNDPNNLDYTLFPGKGQQNSNTFAHGFLNDRGIYPSKPSVWLPGW